MKLKESGLNRECFDCHRVPLAIGDDKMVIYPKGVALPTHDETNAEWLEGVSPRTEFAIGVGILIVKVTFKIQ